MTHLANHKVLPEYMQHTRSMLFSSLCISALRSLAVPSRPRWRAYDAAHDKWTASIQLSISAWESAFTQSHDSARWLQDDGEQTVTVAQSQYQPGIAELTILDRSQI